MAMKPRLHRAPLTPEDHAIFVDWLEAVCGPDFDTNWQIYAHQDRRDADVMLDLATFWTRLMMTVPVRVIHRAWAIPAKAFGRTPRTVYASQQPHYEDDITYFA